MLIISVTEFKRNFDKYIDFCYENKEEIRVTKFGKWYFSIMPPKTEN